MKGLTIMLSIEQLEKSGLFPDELLNEQEIRVSLDDTKDSTSVVNDLHNIQMFLKELYLKLIGQINSKIMFGIKFTYKLNSSVYDKQFNCLVAVDEGSSNTAEKYSFENSIGHDVEILRIHPDVISHGEAYFITVIAHEIGHMYYSLKNGDKVIDVSVYKYFHQRPNERISDWFSLMVHGSLEKFHEGTSVTRRKLNDREMVELNDRVHQFDKVVHENKELFSKFGLVA